MQKIYVKNNGKPLSGKIVINGAKNSALPIMAATILANQKVTLHNVPSLSDVSTMSNLLTSFGAKIDFIYNNQTHAGHTLQIDGTNINETLAPHDIVSKMRASCLTLGPLLAKFKKAKVAFPGGCIIGARPIDMHLNALHTMGAQINLNNHYVEAFVESKLKGATINFNIISVGATENIMMAATLAQGKTIINNAATEPEVVDLANFLINMGAQISGVGTRKLIIEGVEQLTGCHYSIIPDRLEAGTYALAAVITGGEIEILGVNSSHIKCIINQLQTIGAKVYETVNGIVISRKNDVINPIRITTNPYPNFPSDMQAQFAAVLCLAQGVSVIEENVFENRFMYVSELKKMGANITIDDKRIIIKGVRKLQGTDVKSTDLRAAAALLIASLMANGETVISDVNHLYRGYEAIEQKLSLCGANILLVNESQLAV